MFVFDGPHKPPFKRGVNIAPNAACLSNVLTKELLDLFGFPYHTAPGEAEAECALFQKQGIVDAVLSEDVDTLMFGCSLSLRNWTGESTRGKKSPTHVNVYTAEATKNGEAKLESEGMILIALMSGGDYIPAGIPGCGIKIACEVARAGFGRDLCRLSEDDVAGLQKWRERLEHELKTNENKFFRQRHKAVKVPESFPDKTVLGYYTHPVVSSPEKVSRLRADIRWDQEINVPELRLFVAEQFNWPFLPGAKKFIRGLAPALLAHQLIVRRQLVNEEAEGTEAKALAESHFAKAVCGRRAHWNTDGCSELKIAYIPAETVGLDLESEQICPYEVDDGFASGTEQADSAGESRSRSTSPFKRQRPSTYDPNEIEKVWVLETYVKLGVPLLVESWEEDMRNPKKSITRKAREKTALSKMGMKAGAMDQFVKVTKPRSSKADITESLTKDDRLQILPPVFLAPSITVQSYRPQKQALSENKNPVGQKMEKNGNKPSKTSKPKPSNAVSMNQAPSPSRADKAKMKKNSSIAQFSPSSKNPKENPWTLAKRPSVTFGIKSPTRYSALGIYPSDDDHEKPNSRGSAEQPIPLSSSPMPDKKHPRTPSPLSEPENNTNPPQAESTNHLHASSPQKPPTHPCPPPPTDPTPPETPKKTQPSPRKKRSPFH